MFVSLGSPIRQETTHASGQHQRVSPMVHFLQDREIGRTVLVLAMALTRGITKDPSLKLMLFIGLAALWNGRLLGNRYPRISYAIEQSGAVCVVLAFFGLVGSYLPSHLVWVPCISFLVSVAPFILSWLPTGDGAPENLEPQSV